MTTVVSRLLAPPLPAQLRGTTPDAAALRRGWASSRGSVALLLGWAVAMAAAAFWLGVR